MPGDPFVVIACCSYMLSKNNLNRRDIETLVHFWLSLLFN